MFKLISRLCRAYLRWYDDRQTPRYFALAPYESVVIRSESGELRTVTGRDIELSSEERAETLIWRKRLRPTKSGQFTSEEMHIYEVDTRERALDFVGLSVSSSDEVLMDLDIRLHLSISAPQLSVETTKSLFPAVESMTQATISEVSGEFPADDIARVDQYFTTKLQEALEPALRPLGICLHRIVLVNIKAPAYFEEHLKELGSFKLAQRLEAVGGVSSKSSQGSTPNVLQDAMGQSDERAQSAAHYLFAMRLLDQLPVFLEDGQAANLLDVLKEYFRTQPVASGRISSKAILPESAGQDPATMDIPSSEQP